MKANLALLAIVLIAGTFLNSCTKIGECSNPPTVSPSEYHLQAGNDSAELHIDGNPWWINGISLNGNLLPDSILASSKDRDSLAGKGIVIEKISNSLIKVKCSDNHTGETRNIKYPFRQEIVSAHLVLRSRESKCP